MGASGKDSGHSSSLLWRRLPPDAAAEAEQDCRARRTTAENTKRSNGIIIDVWGWSLLCFRMMATISYPILMKLPIESKCGSDVAVMQVNLWAGGLPLFVDISSDVAKPLVSLIYCPFWQWGR